MREFYFSYIGTSRNDWFQVSYFHLFVEIKKKFMFLLFFYVILNLKINFRVEQEKNILN